MMPFGEYLRLWGHGCTILRGFVEGEEKGEEWEDLSVLKLGWGEETHDGDMLLEMPQVVIWCSE